MGDWQGVDDARHTLLEMTKPGVVTDFEQAFAAGQNITKERYRLFAAAGKVYPTEYPPPPAGDGRDVFKAADEAGEGKCTRKEIAKYLMRNQTLRHRLREGWAQFNTNFGTEDIAENHEELDQSQFCELWAKAAALRTDGSGATKAETFPKRLNTGSTNLLLSAPGLDPGAIVRLTKEACNVETDYDWSQDPLQPGDSGTVIVDPMNQEWLVEDEDDGIQVLVKGPRGKSDWYAIGDVELVSLSPSSRSAARPAATESMFKRLDKGRKGWLSSEDFYASFSVIGELDSGSISDLFMAADADGDNKVSEIEWMQFAKAYPNFVASAVAGSAAPFQTARGSSKPTNGHSKPVPAVDSVRAELGEMTKPGVVTDHDMSLQVAQRITEQRYRHYNTTRQVYPSVYPPPPAGDGSDVFKAADEGGEGMCTRKEIAKYLMRNQTLRHRLREGWEKFNSNFGTEDIAENHEELNQKQFCALWQEAAKLRS